MPRWPKGFPEAIETVFPKAAVQLCIVHMLRHSLNYMSWRRRAEVAADLKRIDPSAPSMKQSSSQVSLRPSGMTSICQ